MLLRPPRPTLFPYTTLFRSLPVAVLIPQIGTRRTMLGTACVLALAAVPALGRRYLLVPAMIGAAALLPPGLVKAQDRKSTRLNSSHPSISYAVFCLKKKKNT